ncbi:MAG: MJ1477/TM1410 family putative glycoside hydrolase [Desulfurobacteriaceae bacterium]
MYRVVFLVLLYIFSLGCSSNNEGIEERLEPSLKVESWAYQLQNASVEELSNSPFELVVIDYSRDGTEDGRYTREEIEKLKERGKIPIAYISIGEAESYRFYWNDTWSSEPPSWLGEENTDWKENYAVKYWDVEWKKIIYNYIDKIVSQGFLGLYLDKVDEFEYWAGKERLTEEDTAQRMIDFIEEIASYCREKLENCYIVPQNGERILGFDKGKLVSIVSGWAVEDMFYDGTVPVPIAETEERLLFLSRIKNTGKPIFSVDYVDDGINSEENINKVKDYLSKAKDSGLIPYVARTDRNLDELVIIKW